MKKEPTFKESETIELKKSLTQLDDALKTICGFLNHKGGKVYFGVDNSGAVITEADCDFKKPDYLFHFPNAESLVEISSIPEWCKHKCTFKTSKVRTVATSLEYTTWLLVPMLNEFLLFSQQACQWMMDNLRSKIYETFCPNKNAVQIGWSDIGDLYRYKTVSPFAEDKDKEKLLTIDKLIVQGLVERTQWSNVGFEDMPSATEIIAQNRDLLSQ